MKIKFASLQHMPSVALLSIFFLSFMFSCSTEEKPNDKVQLSLQKKGAKSDLSSIIRVQNTTNLIGPTGLRYSINEIICEPTDSTVIFKLKTYGEVRLIHQNERLMISDLKFILRENQLSLKDYPEVFLTRIDGKIIVNTPNDATEINKIDNINARLGILIEFLDEISFPGDKVVNLVSRPCAAQYQVVVVGYGATPGGAAADLEAGIDEAWAAGDLDCSPLDSAPTMNTIAGGFIHTATKSFCCDGRGGGGGSW